ncbi:MAG TPA: hypothetical protein VL171_11450 [Verrucomicrobiae bacterium]|nr:hypothetical protein [Verrucomicrobiae bacterium]
MQIVSVIILAFLPIACGAAGLDWTIHDLRWVYGDEVGTNSDGSVAFELKDRLYVKAWFDESATVRRIEFTAAGGHDFGAVEIMRTLDSIDHSGWRAGSPLSDDSTDWISNDGAYSGVSRLGVLIVTKQGKAASSAIKKTSSDGLDRTAPVNHAEDGGLGRTKDITLSSGRVLHNANVIRHDAATLTIRHDTGIERIDFSQLPESLQKEYGYNEFAAAQFRVEEQSRENAEQYRREQTSAGEASAAAAASSASGKVRTASNSDCILVKDSSWKQVEQNDAYASYSVMMAVQNSCSSAIKVRIELQGVDKEGFEVDGETVRDLIPGSSVRSVSDKFMVGNQVAGQLVQWKIKSIEVME